MSKGGSSTTVQKSDPWKGVQPYLTGQTTTNADGTTTSIPGVYPDTANLYQNSGWSDAMQGNADNYLSQLQGRSRQTDQAYGAGNAALSGAFDSNSRVASQMVDPTQSFGSMGAANPTNSISQMLSGQANTSTLDPVVNSAMTRLTDNFNTSVMPSLRSNTIAAGQYGGSRQGIAEGLATKGLSQSMGDVSANMYNNAYNTAQGLMGSTANNMAGLALNNSTNNANRDLLGQTTNANLELQQNAQALSNRQAGLNMLGYGNNLQDSNYSNTQNALNSGNAYNWDNLNNYASIVNNGAKLGGTSSSTSPTSTNYLSSGLGGALAGAQLAGATGLMGTGAGAGIGSLLGLLSDRRLKSDIKQVGTLDNGLPVYTFKYKNGDGTTVMGVMADEVKEIFPELVGTTEDGFDFVYYGGL